jgi:glycosyltransferase involved in cell wall biosynthesis
MVETIAVRHSVALLCIRPPRDESPTPSFAEVNDVYEVALPHIIFTSSRTARIASALRGARGIESTTDRAIVQVAVETRADVVVTVGPWLGPEYCALFRALPTMHLFEEDVRRDWELGSHSWRGRLFRRVEAWLYGRARAQPEIVVTISRREARPARRWYPRAKQLYMPLTLSRAAWPVFADPSDGDSVLVVGNLGHERNSEGLAAVLEEMARRPDASGIRIRIVSGSGLHPSLQPFIDAPWVEYEGAVGSLVECYRDAWASLVPAVRVTGQKTTILQAWACACPVVCFDAAAAPMETPGALLTGRTAAEVVDRLVSLSEDRAMRQQLVRAGLAALSSEFNPDTEGERVLAAIEDLRRARPRTASLK